MKQQLSEIHFNPNYKCSTKTLCYFDLNVEVYLYFEPADLFVNNAEINFFEEVALAYKYVFLFLSFSRLCSV